MLLFRNFFVLGIMILFYFLKNLRKVNYYICIGKICFNQNHEFFNQKSPILGILIIFHTGMSNICLKSLIFAPRAYVKINP